MRLPLSLFLLLAALSCVSLALPVQEEKTGDVANPDPSLAVDASTPAAPSASSEAPTSSEESQEEDKSDEDASPAVTNPPPTHGEDKKEGDDDSSSSEEKDADAAPTEAPSATPVKEMTRGEITTLKPDPNSGLDPHDDDNTTTKSPDTPTPTPKPSPTPTPTPAPTTAKPSPSPTTAVPVTPTAAPAVPDAGRKFDGWSFIGGIVLCLVSFAIAFVGFKYYRVRRGQAGGLGGNYNRF